MGQCPSLNLATKHVEVPQTPYIDKVAVMPVVMQRQAPRPSINQATKHVEVPQTSFIDKVAVMPVVMQRQAPRPSINQVTKYAEIPQLYVDKVVDTPVVMQRQVPQVQTAPINEVTKHAVVMQRQVPRIQTSWKIVAQFVGTFVNVPVIMVIMPLVARKVPQIQTAEDPESPAGAARDRTHVQIVDVPVLHVALQERTLERMHEQIVDVPVPQKMKEGVELVRCTSATLDRRKGDQACRDSTACGEATTDPSDSNCAKSGGCPVDQPGDQACRFPTDSTHRQGCRYACGDAANGPSDSDWVEDSGNPAGAVRQSYGGACDHADAPAPPDAAIVPAPVLQVTVPVPSHGAIVEVTKLDPAKCSAEDVDDILEAIKDIPLERISEGVAKKILALSMEPWQCEESRAVRERIAARYA